MTSPNYNKELKYLSHLVPSRGRIIYGISWKLISHMSALNIPEFSKDEILKVIYMKPHHDVIILLYQVFKICMEELYETRL